MDTIILNGIGASPGIAIAKASVIQSEKYVAERIIVADVRAEWTRFEQAIAKAKQEIEAIYELTLQKLGSEKAEIFEGHLMILEDPDLLDGVEEGIQQEQWNAEYALQETAAQFITVLEQLDDELLRGRVTDIQDITNRIMNHLRGVKHVDLSNIQEECIIVTHDLTPSDTAQLNLDMVKGIVTEIGSRTSHSAIMARSLEIPAIVGAGPSVLQLKDGDVIIVDAEKNQFIVHPSDELLAQYSAKKVEQDQLREQLQQLITQPSVSKDGVQVELVANIGNLEDIDRAVELGAEGIGLFRTEFLYMGRSTIPTEEEQFNSYKYALEKMTGKPVVIRTLDIGGDKELPYLQLPKEDNPFLGQRALRFCLAQPDIFRTQLRALLRASVFGNLKIMFPMIAVIEELEQAKQLLEEEKAKLQLEGIAVAEHIEIGMMVEIPSVAISADLFAPHVDFFSIGTNDLIQYTMAADRMNESISYLYQPWHPSILRLIHMVIQAANKEGKWVGMCGEMAGEKAAIPLLLGLGLHEFSMSAGSILSARAQMKQLSKQDWAQYAQTAMSLRDTAAVTAYVQEQQRQ